MFLFFIIGVALIVLPFWTHTQSPTHLQQKVSAYSNARSRTPSSFSTVQSYALPTVPATPLAWFYHTIINNNIFRPLEWRPPRPKEPHRLLGTILPADGDPQAILQATAGNKIHIVTCGDTLGTDTTITDIQAKQVTLEKAGQQRTLNLNPRPWLK